MMKGLLATCKELALLHPNVNGTGAGDVFQLNSAKRIKYPLLWFDMPESELDGNDINQRLTIYYIDRLKDDQTDEVEIVQDSAAVIHDFLKRLSEYYSVSFPVTVTYFNQRFTDICAGGQCEVRVSECPQTVGISEPIVALEPNKLPSNYVGNSSDVQGQNLTQALNWLKNNGGGIQDIIEGTNISIDKTNPKNPIISATGGSTITLDDTVTQTSQNGVKSSGIWTFVAELVNGLLSSVSTTGNITGTGVPANPINTVASPTFTDTLITQLDSVANGGVIPNLQFSFLGATSKSVRSFIEKLLGIVYSHETPIVDITLTQDASALDIDLGAHYRNIEFIMYWSGDGVAGTTQTAIIRINNIQKNVYNQLTTGNSNGWGIPLGRWFIGHLYMRLSSYRNCVGGLLSTQYYTSEAGVSAGTQRNLSTGPDSGFADGIRYISFSSSVANAYGAGTRIIVKKA